ncbi:azurin [Dokdonella sp.]|uniref:azurin n=1 Tax=Dokdonella sp. TaxID=2291710 RepID=UPI003C4D5C18
MIRLLLFATAILFASPAAFAACSAVINGNDAMKFDLDLIEVPSVCKEFTVTLTHSGKLARNIMGHNWVLSRTADLKAIATEGMSAGLDNSYVQPDDKRVIAYTQVIGGGESTSVTIAVDTLSAGADYTFFCSFPGHWSLMKGTLKVI